MIQINVSYFNHMIFFYIKKNGPHGKQQLKEITRQIIVIIYDLNEILNMWTANMIKSR
jgi:hypothetical protein